MQSQGTILGTPINISDLTILDPHGISVAKSRDILTIFRNSDKNVITVDKKILRNPDAKSRDNFRIIDISELTIYAEFLTHCHVAH